MKPIITMLRRETSALLGCICLVAANVGFASESLVVRSADGIHIASVGETGRISYRSTGSNSVEQVFYICHPQALAFSEDGKLLAAGGGRNGSSAKIKVWRISDHTQLCEIIISGEGPNLIAVSPDGRLVVVAKPEGGVAAWSVTDGKQQWSSTLPATAKSVRFSADGKTLRVQCVDGTDRLLDPAHGRELKRRTRPEK